ncbi:MAG: glycosyltransferase family 9 protein [Burkholderiales bacterium]
MSKPFPAKPQRILLLKGHSAGVGDILRSSAAWRALKDRFGDVALHVVLISREPGYVSNSLMTSHHLLAGYTTIGKTASGLAGWRAMADQLEAVARQFRPDLIIDCEAAGMRSSTLVAWVAHRLGVASLGIAEFPTRGWFYSRAAPSTRAYRAAHGFGERMDYTERDFVALAGLGIERAGRPIELIPSAEAKRFGESLRLRLGLPDNTPLLGLNIGCGTPDAVVKRPPLELISALIASLQQRRPLALVLTGAPFERDVNQAFAALHRQRVDQPMHDLAGETDLPQLAGVIEQCRAFISTDSGPYHMAVGQRVPTLALFNRDDATHYHHDAWVRCVQLCEAADVAPAASALAALWDAPAP